MAAKQHVLIYLSPLHRLAAAQRLHPSLAKPKQSGDSPNAQPKSGQAKGKAASAKAVQAEDEDEEVDDGFLDYGEDEGTEDGEAFEDFGSDEGDDDYAVSAVFLMICRLAGERQPSRHSGTDEIINQQHALCPGCQLASHQLPRAKTRLSTAPHLLLIITSAVAVGL